MTLRISFTVNEELAERLKNYANIFAQGEESENVSKVLCNLIEKHIPYLVEDIPNNDVILEGIGHG